MRKLKVEEWLVSTVMSMYRDTKSVVRTVYGNSNGFEVKVPDQEVDQRELGERFVKKGC